VNVACQLQLIRKDKTIRTDLRLYSPETPKVGTVVAIEVDGKHIRAKVTARRPMPAPGTEQIDLLEL
jgi:hypothetical protein